MDNEVYTPPKAELKKEAAPKGSAIKAVIIAVLVDVIGTFLVGIALSVGYGIILGAQGMSPEAIMEEFSSIDRFSLFSLLGMVSGGLITLLAGYLCARIANHAEYKIVAIFAVISVSFGLLMAAEAYNIEEHIFFSLLTILCAYTGAWLHVKGKKE